MAIEIIPKPKVRKTSLINIFIYFLLIIFLVFLISYFVLYFFQGKLKGELLDVEKALGRSPSEENLEESILGYQKKIQDIELLINNHRFAVNIFNYLEKFTHPKVWFSEFKLDSEKGKADISGSADDFEVLGQQTLIFGKQEFIKDINLSKVSIGREGEIKFDLQLTFDPQIFTPVREPQPLTGQE